LGISNIKEAIMPFLRPTILEIKDRIEKGIEARLFGKVALLRNAILRILARVFAGAIHGNYGYIQWLTEQLFIMTSETEFLDRHGLLWGVNRKPGSFASGTVIFSGNDGIIIPLDTRIQNEDGIEYGTTIIGTITGGTVSITIQAVEAGEDGNYVRPNPPDPIYLQMISPISGVDDTIEIDGDITGGEDVEADEDYRARILQRVQLTPAGGSESDYIIWANSVPGVARSWCYPLANGLGTVVVAITATGDNPVPSALLISDVQASLNELKPVTADLTIVSVTDTLGSSGTAKMSFVLKITPIDSFYQEAITNNLKDLFLPQKPGTTIPISQIRAAIFNSGITDYEITSISVDGIPASIDDIVLTGYQYPTLDSITFSELL